MRSFDMGCSLCEIGQQQAAQGMVLTLLSQQEFESGQSFFPPHLVHYAPHGRIRFCKIERHPDYLLGTLCIPPKSKKGHAHTMAFYLFPQRLVLISDDSFVSDQIARLSHEGRELRTASALLHALLDAFLEKDLPYLEGLEEELERLEEDALVHVSDHFIHRMFPLKKEISRFYRYYSQLQNFCALMAEELGDDDGQFRLLSSRISLLREETAMLRDYTLQLRESFQAQTDIRQNNIMKVLTIVTVLFLPLSVIAGWYGMNFENMPELHWPYGYAMVAVISLLILILCIVLFKKKKFW